MGSSATRVTLRGRRQRVRLTCDHKVTYWLGVDDDLVFKALADPVRRLLLDRLHAQSGQTLSDLCAHSDLSRFGVMKHLRVLERAHLVVTKRQGREKLHFINAVPIRRIHDRWISKYAEQITRAMTGLKELLEAQAPATAPKRKKS